MDRRLGIILIAALLFSGFASPADAQTRTVQVINETTRCYSVNVKGFGNDGTLLYIGHERIDAKAQRTFKYSYAGNGLSLLVSADACYHGPVPGSMHAKDARASERFSIVQPGESVHIVRRS
jgi:hypothetical protein